MDVEVSIDRLTIMAHDAGTFQLYLENDPYIKGKGFSSNYGFKYSYTGLCGEHIEVGDRGKVRIDFNPNKADMEQLGAMLKHLKYPYLTRLDIAVDYFGIDLSPIDWTSKGRRKRNYWVDQNGKLETLYIGAPASSKRFRIYNKALERLEAGEEADPRGKDVHWRVEVQQRFKSSDNILDPIENLLPNLFDIVPTSKNIDLSHIKKFSERMIVAGLLERPEEISKADKKTKAKYNKLIAEARAMNKAPLAVTPQQAYEKEKSRLADELTDLFAKSHKTMLVI